MRPPESRSRRNVSSPSPLESISSWFEVQELGLLRLGTIGLFDKCEEGEEGGGEEGEEGGGEEGEEEGEEEDEGGNCNGVPDEEGEEVMVVVILVLYVGLLPSVLGLVA